MRKPVLFFIVNLCLSTLYGSCIVNAETLLCNHVELERELVSAGFFGPNSVVWFQAIRLSMLIGMPLILHIALSVHGTELKPSSHLSFLAVAGCL